MPFHSSDTDSALTPKKAAMVCQSLDERRFPNEIFALILGTLDHHHEMSSLRNAALVCREFAQISRPLIFREVNLEWKEVVTSGERIRTTTIDLIADLLRDPRSAHLGSFIQALRAEGGAHDVAPLEFILNKLPSLLCLHVYVPVSETFQIIQARLGEKLTILQIGSVLLENSEEVQIFQNMLDSLKGLQVLTLISVETEIPNQQIILPKLLEVLCLGYVDGGSWHAIRSGLETSNRSSLKTIVLDCESAVSADRDFWEAIGSKTLVVVDVFYMNTLGILDTYELTDPGKVWRKIILPMPY